MLVDLVNEAISVNALNGTLTASTQGASNDFSDGEVSFNMVVDAGAMTTANVTSAQVQAEEWSGTSADTWAVIAGCVVTVTATTAAANLHQVVRGLRSKQYVRANAITVTGTTTTAAFPGVNVDFFSQRKFVPIGSGGFDRYPSS